MIGRRQHCRTIARDDRGSTAVEFAFIAPPLLLFLIGTVEGGRMLWMQNALQYAVEQASRCAVVDKTNCGTDAQIQTYAAAKAYRLNVPSSAFTITTPTCGKQIAASLAYTTLAPVQISLTLKAKSCHPT